MAIYGQILVRLVTLNVRYATRNPTPGEKPWAVRCPGLCSQIKFITSGHPSAFLCLQEVTYPQLLDIEASLGPCWGRIGRGRDDGKNAGEFSPIFYRADHWVCERNKTFWLSETPDVPSKGWDATLPRIVTMGSFRHKETSTSVVIMSTHLDHSGQTAREQSAHLLLKLARSWTEGGDGGPRHPLFLGGDFNSTPSSRVYKTLTSPTGMKDIKHIVPEAAKYGNREITYTSFGEETPTTIDYLFTLSPQGLDFSAFGILPNRFDDGLYLSDHRPVVADVEVQIRGNDRS